MASERASDPVSAPAHYEGDGEVTCMRALRSAMSRASVPPTAAYWWGCAFKYVWRWPLKNGVQDVRKAIQCLRYLLYEMDWEVPDGER